MASFSRLGSMAAFLCAATYLFGIVMMVVVLEPAGYQAVDATPQQQITFLSQNATALSSWYLGIYILNAIALTVLVGALHNASHPTEPVLAQLSAAFGLIWCVLVFGAGMIANVGLSVVLGMPDPIEAARMWHVVSTIENGLGGGNEIAGGVWIIVTSLAARAILSPALRWTGIVIGACGLATILPSLEVFGMVFGLGFIAWFIWIGLALRRM